MKEIVVISGKGGTGKTSVTASFAVLGNTDLVVADCDVDAADMHVFLDPDYRDQHDFYSGELARIDPETCIRCGKCAEVCRFDAIDIIKESYHVKELDCEGCGYCARVCPVNAISNIENHVGYWYLSRIRTGAEMIHARMNVGAENSGKLVARVKQEAVKLAEATNKNYVLVDGSPGIGCPVISSLSGASYAVLVTEPTLSGLHDLERVYSVVERFRIPAGCIINKADLNIRNRDKILEFLKEKNIGLLAELPYDLRITDAMVRGKSMVEEPAIESGKLLEKSWKKIIEILNEKGKEIK
ncbi:MAG: ATP-binding protein [Candidatus Marinimicrobia bacterium]|jgi:MinD superfamily P-loop ATPase|nr:ATP-binding protein [Candidatus Neomarinimicrobiota bacterium]MDD5709338.1 ATP-binding protein [Candidatus Neomarinimicrobiota bacterium]MDX9778358.1 ATP-binding protein [bacterium]